MENVAAQAQPISIPDEKHASVHLIVRHIMCNVRGCKRPAEYEIDTRTAKCLNLRLCGHCMGFVIRGVEHFKSLRAPQGIENSVNDRMNDHINGYGNGYDNHA